MSIMFCHKHDEYFDSDFVEDCEVCINIEDGYEPREEDQEEIDNRINQIIEERNGL